MSAQKHITGVLREMFKQRSCINRLIPAILDRNILPTLAMLIDGMTGNAVVKQAGRGPFPGAFGLGNRVALSVAITHKSFGIAVYDTPNGAETVIAISDLPLYIVGETCWGWIAVKEDHSLLLVSHGHMETLYDCGASVSRR